MSYPFRIFSDRPSVLLQMRLPIVLTVGKVLVLLLGVSLVPAESVQAASSSRVFTGPTTIEVAFTPGQDAAHGREHQGSGV